MGLGCELERRSQKVTNPFTFYSFMHCCTLLYINLNMALIRSVKLLPVTVCSVVTLCMRIHRTIPGTLLILIVSSLRHPYVYVYTRTRTRNFCIYACGTIPGVRVRVPFEKKSGCGCEHSHTYIVYLPGTSGISVRNPKSTRHFCK